MVKAVNPGMSPRAEQATRTRQRILEAAGETFVSVGYGAARIDDIAARAGVAVPTVYKVFANKRTLLIGAIGVALSGEEEGRVDAQSWWTEQIDEPDAARQLHLVARNARRIYTRLGALLTVLAAAARGDAELDAYAAALEAQRAERSLRTARSLQGKLGNRMRVKRSDAALTLLTLTNPALFNEFVAAGRTPADYERWLGDVLVRALIS